jgi:hypothetical protein
VQDVYPTECWQDADLLDFFQNRFGGGSREWIHGGNKALAQDGSLLRATAFWSAVRRRAEELLQRPPKPGVDYALTEIVHCKSRREIGVREAFQFCGDLYLEPVIELSAARVIVVLGRLAEVVIRERLDLDEQAVIGPIDCFGKERIIAFLPHPAAYGVRSFEKCLTPDQLQKLREFMERMM